ncbi:RNA-directed DNA polymerase [Bacteroides caecigallinarum]|nr:RNA-directed DNA polymerase [Bacteroides caecigallinarum]
MSVEQIVLKGLRACNLQAMSNNEEENGNAWSCVRYNGNNAWCVVLASGGCSAAGSFGRLGVWPVSEFDIIDCWLAAESECYKNKHASFEATRYHYHLSKIFDLIERINNGYKPTTSICFVLDYPVYREVFAANYTDRIVHHYIAPMINQVAEAVHQENGDVSHGNRIGHSASTAVRQIYDNIKAMSEGYTRTCYVATMDMSGFFMSIDKDVAYRVFEYYAYRTGVVDKEKLELLKILIAHNPTEDCERRSPIEMWEHVSSRKSLFSTGEGKGLPIGNFYSQLIANLVMALVDERMKDIQHVRYTRFVDDMCFIARTTKEVLEVREMLFDFLGDLKLTLHRDKFYIQPYWHGVKFCGKVVKCNRIYISNRTVGAITEKIRVASYNPNQQTAGHLMQSINSYFGLMKDTASFSIRKRIMNQVLDAFSEWLYFIKKGGVYICRMKARYNPVKTSIVDAKKFIESHNGKNKYIRKTKNKRKKRNINSGIQEYYEIR